LIDITRRKRAESRLRKSEANMNAIFNNTDIAYVLVDRKLRLLSYNEAAANFARKELKVKARPGDYVPDLFPPGKKERMAEFFGKSINGEMTEYEVCYQQADQGCNWYNVRIFPISGGVDVTFGSIATVTDITERKRTELNREQITKDLIYRNEALNQFTYIISHNLRAPVSSILGLANVLNEMEMTNEEKSEAIAGIAEATHKLDEVIKDLNNILQVKNEVHRYKEEVSFSGLVAEIEIYINRFYVDEKINIITDFSALEKFNTIKSYFHSIFYNLISNSIKYRNPRIDAVIEIRSEISGDFFALTFKDNGIGFNLDEVGDRIFEMYRRFHLHVEGKGMGLYMVKTQVESLGGKIIIKSEVNKGTEFRLEFPI
jgi:PAS domain S-box-containing protein